MVRPIPSAPSTLAGRDSDVAALHEAIQSGSVVLLGPPGIGKTRLATEIVAHARDRGVATAWVSAPAIERPIPLLVLRPLVGDAVDPTAAIHTHLGLGPLRPGPGDPIVVVDDAQHLDDSSAAVLDQLLDAGRVRLLFTVRDGSPLSPAVTRILRRDAVRRVSLGAVDDASVVSIAEGHLGGPLDGRSARMLCENAQGNPLLVRELVSAAVQSRALEDLGGMWVLRRSPGATLILDDLVSSRLDRLGADERNALELVVVAGRLRLGALLRSAPAEAVEGLEREGLVRVQVGSTSPEPIVDVAHPIYREVLRARLGPLATLRIHRTLVAAAGHMVDASPDERLQCEVWKLQSGAPIDAREALAGARRASELKDPVLAGDLALASYRADPSADAAVLACWCLGTTGRGAEADALAAQAQQEITDPIAQVALVLRRAEEHWWWAQDPERARTILRTGLTELPDGPWLDLLRAQEGVFAALDGDAVTAWTVGSRYLDHDAVWVRRTAGIAAAFGALLDGRIEESVSISDISYAVAQTDPDLALSGDAAIHVMARLYAGIVALDAEQTLGIAEMVYSFAVREPAIQSRGWASLMLALAQLGAGRPLSAARSAREAELLWIQAKLPGLCRWSATAQVFAHLHLGDTTAAKEAEQRASMYNPAGFRLNATHEARARSALLAANGDVEAASAVLLDATERALGQGALVNAAECLAEFARLRLDTDVTDWIDRIGPLASRAVQAHLTFATGSCRADAALVEHAAQEYTTSGRALSAAEAWSAASQLHRRAGRSADAARCAAQSADATRTCESVRTPLLLDPLPADRLSAREREIAQLAGSGATNREIAERLVVSERTVESHLYRVFAKLGISTRSELASHLG